MTVPLESPVTERLESLDIPYALIEIPLDPDRKPIRSLEELLTGQNRNPSSIVRSLLFRTGSDSFVLLAVTGGGKADWGVLRKHLNERRLTMAEPTEVLAATGFPIGAVPPIALPANVRVLVDVGVFEFDEVIIGSGILGYALGLSGSGLQQALGEAEIGQFIKA